MDTPGDSLNGAKILIVDDTPANLDLLAQVLESHGCTVLAAPGGDVALRIAARADVDLILLDVLMPDPDGYETCRRLKTDAAMRDVPVLFISAKDEAQSLVDGFAAGAVDYIAKPFQAEEVVARVGTHLRVSKLTRALREKNAELERQSADLTASNEKLREEMRRRASAENALQAADERLSSLSDREAERWGIAGLIGRSRTINRIVEEVKRLQNFGSVNVLVTGESGTGKELVARALHFGSNRSKGPFIAVNCVAIPEELAESMLFGHVRGAFTGATMDRKGYFEMAHGGTLFLDEIGDMPVTLQAKLLRVLEDGCVTPLGSTRERKVDVRIVAATNANLAAQIDSGAFRQDLYFRLAQYTVSVPPLRERRDDVPLLAQHFLRLFAAEMGIPSPTLDAAVMRVLAEHPFPGNVRELKNVIERGLIESGGLHVRIEHLRLGHGPSSGALVNVQPKKSPEETAAPMGELPLNLEAAENMLIRRALAETGGNIAEAARRLGVNRTRIYRKLSETNATAE
ncbi:MAG TPA: sigma-54 dependent transcriptional regulator [Tepidisphaeraceae bacterium]|jgi:DNA-binding NtrC family response regulator|nr:sigma-54 dependent transcriptional regulator [Tepidisphaeraceae bacterium]